LRKFGSTCCELDNGAGFWPPSERALSPQSKPSSVIWGVPKASNLCFTESIHFTNAFFKDDAVFAISTEIAGKNSGIRIRRVLSAAVAVSWAMAAMAGPAEDLMSAVTRGDAAAVRVLLAKGADANAMNDNGVTALMAASFRGDREVVLALLNKGAEIDAKLVDGTTALFQALGHGDVVRLLLLKGADVNAKLRDGDTVLMWASKDGLSDVVHALLANGAGVNAKTVNGETALMAASKEGRLGVVEALLSKGAEVNAKTKDGTTALRLATDAKIKALLMQAGAKP
jgi:uncharacterized protein